MHIIGNNMALSVRVCECVSFHVYATFPYRHTSGYNE